MFLPATTTNYFSTFITQFHSKIKVSKQHSWFAGSSLYGGWVDLCITNDVFALQYFKVMFHFQEAQWQSSVISSNPTRVCVCKNDIYDCNITQYNVTAYPGETFQIPAVAVGQRFGTVATIHSTYQVHSSQLIAHHN